MPPTSAPTLVGAPVHATPPARRRSSGLHSPRVLWFTAPSLAWFAVFSVGPLLAMFVIATLSWKGLIYQPTYVGLANVRRVLADPTFHAALRNSAFSFAKAMARGTYFMPQSGAGTMRSGDR